MVDVSISAAGQHASVAGTDRIPASKAGVSGWHDVTDLLASIGLEAQGDNTFVMKPSENYVDPTAGIVVLLAAGSPNQPNYIGTATEIPVGGSSEMGWTADTDYVAGGASPASILGGYDQIVNQIAGVSVGVHHAMMAYNTTGHSVMVGASYVYIDSGRAGVFAATNAKVLGNNYGLIVGGDDEELETGAGTFATIINSQGGRVSGGSRNVVLSGQNNEVSGTRSAVIAGSANVVSGDDAAAVAATSSLVQSSGAVAFGKDVKTFGAGLYLGIDKITAQGDAMSVVRAAGRIRSTSASNFSLRFFGIGAGSDFPLTFPAGSSGFGRCRVVGRIVGTSEMVAYQCDFGFHYDGTNRFLFKSGTETALDGTDKEVNLDLVSQTNNDFTPGAAPRVRLNSAGLMNIRVTGIAATNIDWLGTFDFDVLCPS